MSSPVQSESNKKKSLMYKKKWKINVWSLDLGKKNASVIESNFFYYYQRIHKEKLFLVIKVRIEKQVFEVRKMWKTNIWNLHLSEKNGSFFFFKICLLAAKEVALFFLIITKRCAKRSSLSVWESNSKNNSSNYKKSEKN